MAEPALKTPPEGDPERKDDPERRPAPKPEVATKRAAAPKRKAVEVSALRRLARRPAVERQLLRGKRAVDWLSAKLLIGILRLARRLPPERSTDLAERIGRLFAPVLPRTALAKENLALAFPDASPEQIDRWARGVWGNTTRLVGEFVFLDELVAIDPDHPERGRVEIRGIENFLAIRDGGRPTIMVTAHTGNWEILPVVAAANGLSVTALFRPPNNPYVRDELLAARRTATGTLVPSQAGAAWALAGVLERGGTVGLLADQWFRRGAPIRFMGRPTRANPLAAKLARHFDCDIYPARCVRLPGGRFRLEIEDRLELPRDERGTIDVQATTQRINDRFEAWIREYPDQWLWLHKRWK